MAEGRGRDSARRPKSFSLLRQRKVLKRKATLLAATPSLCYGATWVGALAGWAAELTSRSLSAPFGQLRPVRARSSCILRCTSRPASTPTQAHPEGSGSPHGPSLRSALGVGCHRMRCNGLSNSTPLDPPELDRTEPARSPPRRWLQSQKEKRGWGKPTWEAAPAAATRPDVDRTSLHPGRAQRWPELDFPPLWTCREAQRVRRAGAPKDAHAS